MSNGLKALRLRIKSIISTQKITKAMYVVSAAKLKKNRSTCAMFDAFRLRVNDLANSILSSLVPGDLEAWSRIMLFDDSSHVFKNDVVIVIGADRGLCGSFSSTVIKKFKTQFNQFKNPKIIAVGHKIVQSIKSTHPNNIVASYSSINLDPVAYENTINEIAEIVQSNITNEATRVFVVYTKFNNVMSYTPIVRQILPVLNEDQDVCDNSKAKSVAEIEGQDIASALMSIFIKAYISYTILNSKVSEEAARMTAMDNANRNAKKMVDELKLVMNRQRQGLITKELIEVISGAEAV